MSEIPNEMKDMLDTAIEKFKHTQKIRLSPPRKPAMYEWLKKNNPTHKLVLNYDEAMKTINEAMIKEPIEKVEVKIIEAVDLYDKSFYLKFKESFKKVNRKEFEITKNIEEQNKFIRTLMYYFMVDDRFYKSPLLSDFTDTDLKKPLWIIGTKGSGKSAIMKTFLYMIQSKRSIQVRDMNGQTIPLSVYFVDNTIYSFDADILRLDYERDKKNFKVEDFPKIIYIDDILSEKKDSFNAESILGSLIKYRIDNNLLTHISSNYYNELNAESTFSEVNKRYSGLVESRLNQYNVILLKGIDLRKKI